MHDAWTKCGNHYMREQATRHAGRLVIQELPTATLLSVGPMSVAPEDEEEQDSDKKREEATTYNAKVMYDHIDDIVHGYYHVPRHPLLGKGWLTCIVADNTSTNKKMAKLMNLPTRTRTLRHQALQVWLSSFDRKTLPWRRDASMPALTTMPISFWQHCKS